MHINLHDICADGDIVKTLFAENPGVVIEVSDEHKQDFKDFMEEQGVGFAKIGYPVEDSRTIVVKANDTEMTFDIDALRDTWYKTSYLLDRKQSFNGKAKERFENYKNQPLEMIFPKSFTGKLSQYGLILTAGRMVNRQWSMVNLPRPPLSVKRVPMVSARWLICSTSPAST